MILRFALRSVAVGLVVAAAVVALGHALSYLFG
jgi:hypothetical protein